MRELLSNGTVMTVLIAVCAAIILGIQYFFGYKNWKALGFVLPGLFLLSIVFFYVKGLLSLNIKDIIMPIIGFIVLATSYERGMSKAKERQKIEIDRMKAKDNIQ